MKQVIALNQWLYGLRKIILIMGYIALVAVAAGADVKFKKSEDSSLDSNPSEPIFKMQTHNHKEV